MASIIGSGKESSLNFFLIDKSSRASSMGNWGLGVRRVLAVVS
jgi:hypothetical protein